MCISPEQRVGFACFILFLVTIMKTMSSFNAKGRLFYSIVGDSDSLTCGYIFHIGIWICKHFLILFETLETSANADTLATVFSLSHKVFCYQLWFVRAKSVQLCLTLCDPMDCSPPSPLSMGILQVRILECIVMSSSRD